MHVQVMVSPVMGKGFPMEKVPPEAFDTMLIFATGTGISPIKALIDAGDLDATERKNVTLFYGAHDPNSMAYLNRCDSSPAKNELNEN
jgi:arabinosyltransferase